MLEVDGAIVETHKDVKNFLFGSLDVPLVNLETSLKNYVSVPRELAVSLCIVQCLISYSHVFVQYRLKNLQKSLLIYQWGKMKANQVGSFSSRPGSIDYDSGKGHQLQVSSYDVAICYYGLGMAFLAIAAPSLPCFLGITALFPRLGLMFLGGLVLASFMTYASEHLGIGSFFRGFEGHVFLMLIFLGL